jgi:hypothetical protein
LGHANAGDAPHFSQNITPSRFSNWHFGHFILQASYLKNQSACFQLSSLGLKAVIVVQGGYAKTKKAHTLRHGLYSHWFSTKIEDCLKRITLCLTQSSI